MVRSRLQLLSFEIGPSHTVRRCEPRKPHGSVWQLAPTCAGPAKLGASSACAVAARPITVVVIAEASRAPTMPRRRIWLVFVEVFMALIVHPATAPQ